MSRQPTSSSRTGVPQRIGDFEVIRTLGSGSFGKVKLAKHILTGHRVAMKFISKKKISTTEMSDRVQREIQYLKMLQHPHIIKLYDVIQTSDAIVMVIEYLKGELFDYIVKTGRMAEPQARRFFQQIVASVEYCHSNDIVHRDLKPENLLLDELLNVKIADFGLSNVMRDGDFLRTSCGSPNYAAPEVISGKRYAGPEIDIWSCGVILYVMLCGRLPFDDDHIPMLFKKINGGIFSLPPYLSPGARHLLSRMLLVDSNKRITLAEIRQLPWFQEGLPDYLSNSTIPRKDESEPSSPTLDTSLSGPPEGRIEAPGLGFIEMESVKDLCERVGESLSVDEALRALQSGNEKDKKWRIAYQLCDDHRKAKLAAAISAKAAQGPKRGNSVKRGSRLRPEEEIEEEVSKSHNITVLQTSLPQADDGALARSMHPRNPLSRGVQSMTAPEPPTRSPAPKKPRAKWHFGIRSRSPPLEVMLEIYKTLQTLGFEWKKKEDPVSEAHDSTDEEDPKKRRRREEEARTKVAQALFYVEARCRMDDVMVRMDIQLYKVDDNDNYLVDFRNVGYRAIIEKRQSPSIGHDSGTDSTRSSYSLPPNVADEIRSRTAAANPNPNGLPVDGTARQTVRDRVSAVPRAQGVSSPFLFLECACKLIVELAVGGNSG